MDTPIKRRRKVAMSGQADYLFLQPGVAEQGWCLFTQDQKLNRILYSYDAEFDFYEPRAHFERIPLEQGVQVITPQAFWKRSY